MEGSSGACLDCSSWAGTLDRPGNYAGPQVKHDKSFPKPKMAKHPNFRLMGRDTLDLKHQHLVFIYC